MRLQEWNIAILETRNMKLETRRSPSAPYFLTKIKHFVSFGSFFPRQSFLFYKKLVTLHRYITKYNWLFCKSAKTSCLLRRRHLIVKGHSKTSSICVTFHPKLTKFVSLGKWCYVPLLLNSWTADLLLLNFELLTALSATSYASNYFSRRNGAPFGGIHQG